MKPNSKELRDFIISIAGKEGLYLIRILKKKESTVEDIAKKLEKKPVAIRRILYKLYDYGVVTSNEEASKEHKGWMKFTWAFSEETAEQALNKHKTKQCSEIKSKIEFEKTHVFYRCCKCSARYSYEDAMNCTFKCKLCGSVIEYDDNKNMVSQLEKDFRKFKVEN
ncbi:MAG: hypothetical protein WC974_02080 [Thermoplasmata archaeon]